MSHFGAVGAPNSRGLCVADRVAPPYTLTVGHRLPLTVLALALSIAPAGCARTQNPQTTHIEVPGSFENTSAFLAGLNQVALLPPGSAEREQLRQQLIGYVAPYMEKQLAAGDAEEAMAAMHHTLGMYTPAELRQNPQAPGLAAAAHVIYELAAKTGNEDPAILALAVEHQFGDAKTKKRVEKEWVHLAFWLESGDRYARDLRHVGGVERRLEEAAANFPSPWIVDQLAEIYRVRYQAAMSARSKGEPIDDAQAHRIKYTPYLLSRVLLRADDLDGAIEALEEARDPYMTQLRDKVKEAARQNPSAQAYTDLIAEMRPTDEGGGALPDAVETQGWGIVDNLARRALAKHPNDPFAHYFRAESLRRYGLRQAAMIHYERVLEKKKDVFEVWAHLAELYHEYLIHLAGTDPNQAAKQLSKVENLHARAVEMWPDRPVRPGLADAYVVVAQGLYDVGNSDAAFTLLEKGVGMEPSPEALDMLGNIEAKRSSWDPAWSRYEELLLLPFEDQKARLFWEIRAKMQLGEIAIMSGRPAAGEQQLKAALGSLNKLLSWPSLDPAEKTGHLVDRARVLFFLGEVDLAMDDFRSASALEPEYPLVYAEPLLFAGGHGYYPQALEIYERAMAQSSIDPSLRLYFSLWINDLSVRQGREAPRMAVAFLESYEGEDWHKALAAHGLGKVTYKQLLAQAADPGQRAEAHFYEGLAQWRAGDTANGLKLMRKVLETGMMSFFEYEMAQNYLNWRDLPRTARSPMAQVPAKKTN